MKAYALPLGRTIACLVIIGIVAVWGLCSTVAAASDPQQGSHKLLSVGPAGAKAIDFKVWTQTVKHDKAHQGIPAVVRVKAAEKAYLTSIYLSPNGDAIILLPNKDSEESVLVPNKEYTLFGSDSRIKLKESDAVVCRQAKWEF